MSCRRNLLHHGNGKDQTDLRGIANDFVMPVGKILNSKREKEFAQTWLSRLGEQQEQGSGKESQLESPPELALRTQPPHLGAAAAHSSAWKELEVSRWKSKFMQGWTPPISCQPTWPLPGGAHACARPSTLTAGCAGEQLETSNQRQSRIKPLKPEKTPKNPSATQTHPCLFISIWL